MVGAAVSGLSIVHALTIVQHIDGKLVSFVPSHDIWLDREIFSILIELLLVPHLSKLLVVESLSKTRDNFRF
jgi:hypothetical protein